MIFLAKYRRQNRFGQFGESTCVLGHRSAMDSNGNKLVSSLPCLQNSQNGQHPLLFVPNTGCQSKDLSGDCAEPGPAGTATAAGAEELAPQLRLEPAPNPVQGAQEATDTEVACRHSAGFSAQLNTRMDSL